MGAVRDFMEKHFLHFNARETVAAARAYEEHVRNGGKMLVSLAGAMSTGELGIILSRMIREGYVHAISCTGANLEEDVFNLVAHHDYEIVRSWRELSADDEVALFDRGLNRVTDTCIPEEEAMRRPTRLWTPISLTVLGCAASALGGRGGDRSDGCDGVGAWRLESGWPSGPSTVGRQRGTTGNSSRHQPRCFMLS